MNILSKIDRIELELTNEAMWNEFVDKNRDFYGKGIIDYSERWAKLVQYYIATGQTFLECVELSSNEADTEGISGFMFGASVSILYQTWKYGPELKEWHNLRYGVRSNTAGVVNPAVITLK